MTCHVSCCREVIKRFGLGKSKDVHAAKVTVRAFNFFAFIVQLYHLLVECKFNKGNMICSVCKQFGVILILSVSIFKLY